MTKLIKRGCHHLAWQDIPLKGLCLVQGPGKAIHQKQVTTAFDHGVLQQCNCDLNTESYDQQ